MKKQPSKEDGANRGRGTEGPGSSSLVGPAAPL